MTINKRIHGKWQLQNEILVDVLIVENDALKSLTSLPAQLRFNKLVIGNSNSYNISKELMVTARKNSLNVVNPKKEGAFIMKLAEE